MSQPAQAADSLNATYPAGPSDPAEVEAFLDSAVPAGLAKYNVAGATVAVVKDGRLVLAKGYGYTDIDNKTPVYPDQALFRIGSITKLFTWTAVMQLVEKGKIDLDADVNTYLKDFRIPDTYSGQAITMRHLMTHSAGFEDSTRHMEVRDVKDLYTFREYCEKNIPSRVYPPGTVTSYSNYGTTLAAVIVEDVSGVPFEQYIQEKILTPLEMYNTSMHQPLPQDLDPALANGYELHGMMNTPVPDSVIVVGPAGSISSTATDMAKFMSAHMQNGQYKNATILRRETSDLMHARAFANDPRVAGFALGFYETLLNNQRIIGHSGDTKTFHSLLAYIPEKNAGFFISYNSKGGSRARDELLVEFMEHYYPVPARVVPRPDAGSAGYLQKYAGLYQFTRHNYRMFEMFVTRTPPIEISVSPNGTLVVGGDSPLAGQYVEIQNGVFTRLDGKKKAFGDLVIRQRADGQMDYICIVNMPYVALEPVPLYGTETFDNALRYCSAAILLTVLVWPVTVLFRKVYRIVPPEGKSAAVYARWICGAAALLFFVFMIILLPAVSGNQSLIDAYHMDHEIPLLLSTVMTVPVIATVLSAGALIFTLLAWKDRFWNVWHRVHYTIVTIVLIVVVLWANYWNLFLFRL